MQSLNPEKKADLLRKCESKKMFPVGITAGLHEILRTNYCGSSNYCAPNTAETPIITARVILRYDFK